MQIGIFLWLLPLWNKKDWSLVMQYCRDRKLRMKYLIYFFLPARVVRTHKYVIK